MVLLMGVSRHRIVEKLPWLLSQVISVAEQKNDTGDGKDNKNCQHYRKSEKAGAQFMN